VLPVGVETSVMLMALAVPAIKRTRPITERRERKRIRTAIGRRDCMEMQGRRDI
jgi:hypothetical protein